MYLFRATERGNMSEQAIKSNIYNIQSYIKSFGLKFMKQEKYLKIL